jgi:leucyl aminopeptidase
VITVRLAANRAATAVLVLPVAAPEDDSGGTAVLPLSVPLPDALAAEVAAYLEATEHSGASGSVQNLFRPGLRPRKILLVGVGTGDETGWRSAGAAVVKAAKQEKSLTIEVGAEPSAAAVRGLAEGVRLAGYKYRVAPDRTAGVPALRQVTLVADGAGEAHEDGATRDGALGTAVQVAIEVASATCLARDLTNTPSLRKTPAWFASQVAKEAAGTRGLRVTVRGRTELGAEGFGGILAVGRGSAQDPRLVELSWRPRGATRHVVLVGKGITFDTGGICIKSTSGMLLMRKDMAGAAAVMAATLGVARLGLPVRVTALAPLAENMPGADAWRPGDVVRHYGGQTTEVLNTDAEGRVVLADALAYAARRLRPDVLVDLATLTGANSVALGKRTAALYSDNDALAEELARAAAAAGEKVWRMPLTEDYVDSIGSDLADLANLGSTTGAGSITAALYLREFAGTARDRWAHFDMSAPSWADSADGELVKGATGWGVRTLMRWLQTLATT